MGRSFRFVPFLHALCFLLLRVAPSAETTRLTNAEPASEDIGGSATVKSSLFARTSAVDVPSAFLRENHHGARRLKQRESDREGTASDSDENERKQEYPCPSRSAIRDDYFDAATRTWNIDNAALNAINNDLQAVINCTANGDVVLFDVGGEIRPAAPIVIPWHLTISTRTSSALQEDGVYPEATRKTTFTCPSETEGVFVVRAKSVLFANLAFKGCAFNASDDSAAIVQVEECPSSRRGRSTIQLHHVSFKRNVLISGAGIRTQPNSCSGLELVDFTFEDNACGAQCGVVLSAQNRLRYVSIRGIQASESANARPVVFFAPPESKTSIEHIQASENECSILYVQGGSLDLSNASFARNSLDSGSRKFMHTCVHLVNATGSITDSQFQKNEARSGGAIIASRSNLTLNNNTFDENMAKQGGAIWVEAASSISVRSCAFTSNIAHRSAGVLLASESHVMITDSSFEGNSAGHEGGCFYLDNSSTLELIHSSVAQSSARDGAVAVVRGLSVGNATDTAFDRNSAVMRGGVFRVEEARLFIQGCQFGNNTAEFGGGIQAHSSKLLVQHTSASELNVFKSGGFIAATSSRIRIQDSILRNNRASNAGGGIAGWNESHFKITNLTSFGDKAKFGGAIFLNSKSSGHLIDCRFTRNRASRYGGTVGIRKSTLKVNRCHFSEGKTKWGGFLFARKSKIDIANSSFQKGSASHGGCMRLMRDSRAQVRDSQMTSCEGRRVGGAVQLAPSTFGGFNNVTFRKNNAVHKGGTFHVESSTASLIRCRFADGRADDGGFGKGRGGFVFVCSGAYIMLKDTTMKGGYATEDGGCVSVRESALSANHLSMQNCSASVNGGGIHLYDSTVATIRDMDIRSSNAAYGGGIHTWSSRLSMQDSLLSNNSAGVVGGGVFCMNYCHFEDTNSTYLNNTARFGGAISVEAESSGSLIDSLFIRNTAFVSGGSVLVLNSNVTANSCQILKGNATFGGGIHTRESIIHGYEVTLDGNSASRYGGGLSCQYLNLVNLTYSNFLNNSAPTGGAVHVTNATVVFTKDTFSGNSAAADGGSFEIQQTSHVDVEDSTFSRNVAARGSVFFLSDSRLEITNSKFENGRASVIGGFIYAQEQSSILLEESSMIDGRSLRGGAVALSSSLFKARDVKISQCHAARDGGGILSYNSSRALCSDCVLEGNSATHGGAIFADCADARMLSSQLDGGSVQNNAAKFGGGLYIARAIENSPANRSAEKDGCDVVVAEGTAFKENTADVAGGAVFTDSLAMLRTRCPQKTEKDRLEFTSKSQWRSMSVITSLNDVCPTWTGNTAKRYGPDIATRASKVIKSASYGEKEEEMVSIEGHHYTISDHKSGNPIPAITLRAVDPLDQSPAVGKDNKDIVATMSSPDAFFDGSVRILLNSDSANLTTTGFTSPGKYNLLIEFEGEDLESLDITVEVKNCAIGEVPSGNGSFCEPCSAATFSFHPADDTHCHPCPENANCESRVILPGKGYWHRTPCSEHVQRCLNSEACDADKREENMDATTRDIEACEFDEDYVNNYTDAQCREGHEGPLCGSCKPSYGKSHSFLCEKCFSGFGNIVLVALSFFVLLGLSGITLRSNLSSRSSCEPQNEPSQLEIASATCGPSTVNEQMVEMLVTGHVPREILYPEEQQTCESRQPAEDAELPKWKAVEVFKITINFLQVLAVAIAINVKWTLAMLTLFEAAEFVSGITSEAVTRSVDCLIPAGSSMERSVAVTLIDLAQPLVVIFVFVVIWLVATIRYRQNKAYLLKRAVLSFLAVFYISYISLSKTLVNILNCVEVHDSVFLDIDTVVDYWAVDTSIQCHEGSHAFLSGFFAWPLLVIFSFGFPLSIAHLLVKNVKEDYKQGWVYEVSGFLYRSYRKKYIFWESMIMLRKAILAVVVVFSYPLGANLQQVLGVFALVIALYFQMLCRPYRPEFDVLNEIESASILVSLLTFVSSIFFSDERVSPAVRVLVTVGAAFMNIAMLLCLLSIFFVFTVKYLSGELKREGACSNKRLGLFQVLKVYLADRLFGRLKSAFLSLFSRAHEKSLERHNEA